MLILFLEQLIFYPFLFHYVQKKVLKMKNNCFHFLVSFTFTSKYIEFKQINSVTVKTWNYLQAEKDTLIL